MKEHQRACAEETFNSKRRGLISDACIARKLISVEENIWNILKKKMISCRQNAELWIGDRIFCDIQNSGRK